MADINSTKNTPFNKAETKPNNPINRDIKDVKDTNIVVEKEKVITDNVVNDLKPRKELTKEEIMQLEQLPFKFEIVPGRDGRLPYPTITTAIDNLFFPRIVIRNGRNSINMDTFKVLLLKLGKSLLSETGSQITSWETKLPVRFVKGNVKGLDGNIFPYYSIEIFVTTKTSFAHFFGSSQRNLLIELEKLNQCPIKFVTRNKLMVETQENSNKIDLVEEV